GIAREEMAPVLLHAAAFDPIISQVAFIKPYTSYSDFIENRFYNPRFVYSIVPGALLAYDLPDLAATLAPRKIIIAGPTDNERESINSNQFKKSFKIVEAAYNHKNAEDNLEILSHESIGNPEDLFRK